MTPKLAKKRRKHRWTTLRFRKGDPAHNLLAAAQAWIRSKKGTAVVIGGIGIQEHGPYQYTVCVNVLGQKPQIANAGDTHG